MTDKIYEYKDDKDWYLAQRSDLTLISSFQDDFSSGQINQFLSDVGLEEGEDSLQIHVVKYSSVYRLLSFLADAINQEFDRSLTVVQHSGALLVTEGDKLLSVTLPQGGLATADFFGQKADASFGDSILIATRNEGKTKEFRKMFDRLGIKVENLNDYPDLPDVEETGMTFEENARLKAETISKLTGKMVLSDDSGLKVDVLGGLPGVWSARFSGPDATDDKNNAKLLHELAMVFDLKDRSAQFHTTLVVAAPDKESLVVEADWPGYIATEPKGDKGFGYDPLFIVGETGRHAAELSAEEKNELSHRGLAVKKLLEVFPQWQEAKH